MSLEEAEKELELLERKLVDSPQLSTPSSIIDLREQEHLVKSSSSLIELQRIGKASKGDGDNDDDDCIDEMEKCSLQDNEKCNCMWQILRAFHGASHWLNTLSCIRKRDKHCCEKVASVESAEIEQSQQSQ